MTVPQRRAIARSSAEPQPLDTAAWADRTIRSIRLRYGKPPPYGCAAFHALPPGDPLRLASVLVAAEAWRREGTPESFAERLADELVARQQLDSAAREEIASWAVRRVHAMGNPQSVWYPSHAELVRRREEVVYG
jgi:hypothetical protein